MRDTLLCSLLALWIASAAATAAHAEYYLVQSGQDVSPYAFTAEANRGRNSSAYAFTAFQGSVDHSFEYYLRFNLPPFLFQPDVEIELAYAWIYYGFDFDPSVYGGTANPNAVGEILCHRVLQPWNQLTLTWVDRPAIDNVFDARTGVVDKGSYWCDVTQLLRDWIADPSSNYGIALTSTAERVMGFHTFDDGSVSASFRPTLMVQTVPEPAATAALAAGGALLAALDRRRARRRRQFRTDSNARSSS